MTSNFVNMTEDTMECNDNSPETRDFVKACKVWTKITKFINITKISNNEVEAHKTKLTELKKM